MNRIIKSIESGEHDPGNNSLIRKTGEILVKEIVLDVLDHNRGRI